MTAPAILWFRQDLRLAQNPALEAALRGGRPVIPVFIWAPQEEGAWAPGAASRWWLRESLASLSAELEKRGSRLIIRRGPTQRVLDELATQTGAQEICWNRRYEPFAIARDCAVKARLRASGFQAESFNGNLLFEPWSITHGNGQPFRVFTPFWRACLRQRLAPPLEEAPKRIPGPRNWPDTLPLSELALEPAIDWAAGFRELWQPGEQGAQAHLKRFLSQALAEYPAERDRPHAHGTSRLSPHLHFGEISPAAVWRAVEQSSSDNPSECEAYLRQLAWREFAHHLLYHYPESAERALRPEFARFPWRARRDWMEAWKRGKTGYPLVDAGMRELWHTGWMHNRVRMVVASFLVKHLLISWQEGAAWFWDTLVDADLANNTLGWQWVAGCGADAAPYFRIFNPSLQAEKFDPTADYIRRWVPEVDSAAYPKPIVEHGEARRRALNALASIR
jgi:deoxyribodipyrimidine photo-lyase